MNLSNDLIAILGQTSFICFVVFIFKKDNPYRGRYRCCISDSEKPIVETYQTILTKRNDGKFIKRIFYPETKQITHYIEYLDKQFLIYDGVYIEWYDNGNLWKNCIFKKGLITGKWQYPNGNIDFFEDYKNIKGPEGNESDNESYGKYNFEAIKPSFKGGDSALFQYLKENIIYPINCKNNGVEGKVIVKFVVSKDGSVQDVQVLKGLSDEIRDNVYKLISYMPKWSPGVNNGKPVNISYTLPINFKLE
jgi:periplasmic protein TonB